jgi:hypothetical protein
VRQGVVEVCCVEGKETAHDGQQQDADFDEHEHEGEARGFFGSAHQENRAQQDNQHRGDVDDALQRFDGSTVSEDADLFEGAVGEPVEPGPVSVREQVRGGVRVLELVDQGKQVVAPSNRDGDGSHGVFEHQGPGHEPTGQFA